MTLLRIQHLRPFSGRSFVSVWALVAIWVSEAGSQARARRVVVPDEVSCAACAITVTTVSLSGTEAAPLPERPINAAVDSRGRIWVFSEDAPARIYDAKGRFLQVIGRRGAGPGEYKNGGTLVQLDADTAGVFDISNRRLSMVSPDLRTVRTVPSGLITGAVMRLDGGRFVTTGLVPTPGHNGYAMHIFTIDSQAGVRIERSFGGSGKVTPAGSGGADLYWRVAPSKADGFWTAEPLAYRVHLWDRSFQPQLTLERAPEWFRPQTRIWFGNATTPPNPLNAGVSEHDGILWTFTFVPDPNWRGAWPKIRDAKLEGRGPEAEDVIDTVIEAIDVRAGRVLTRTRMPGSVVSVLPQGRVVMFYHDDRGETRLELHTLRVKR